MANNDIHDSRVATYARVSTQEQAAENTSLASQESQLTAYCQMQGWIIVNSYVDPGFTGKNGDRPGLKQLLSDAKIGLLDKVMVCKLDRMARNLRLLMDIEAELRNFNVSLTSIKESVDTSNSTGKMVFQLFGMIAEWEREAIIERTKSGRIQRYKDGCWASGKPPFGYAYDKTSRKLVINEHQAKIVRLIFNEYIVGKSLTAVDKILDKQRIPTITGKPRGWIDSNVRLILINPVYKGTLIVNRKCHITNVNKVDMSKAIVIKVPPIVTESVWNLAQSNLQSHKKIRPPRKNPWLLQGIISCGQCGLSYQSQNRSSTTRCYACRGRLRASHMDSSPRCTGPTFNADWLENEVWNKIAAIINNPDELTRVIKESMTTLKARHADLDRMIKPIDEKLTEITDKKARLADEWVLNNMNPVKYKELQSILVKEEIRLKSLRANIAPSQLAELENINGILAYWQNHFQSVATTTGENVRGGVQLLTPSKPMVNIYGFDNIDMTDYSGSKKLKRQILDRLQTRVVVFKDHVEIRCQILVDDSKLFNVLLPIKF